MPNTLITRINDLKQYNSKEGKLVWVDPMENRWNNTYGNLNLNDNGIFIGKGKIYIGSISRLSKFKNIEFENVEEYDLQNDEFLQLNEIYPEYISRCKAAFQPFIHPKKVNIQQLKKDISERNFVDYCITQSMDYFYDNISQFNENDRVLIIDNKKIQNIYLVIDNKLKIAPFDSFLSTKGFTLNKLYEINLEKKGEKSNNANRIIKIISNLEENGIYVFNTFFSYHDALYNVRAYGEFNSQNNFPSNSNNNDTMENKNTNPLNQILYGPPGTGKTYNTISKALSIVDPSFYNLNKDNRELLTNRFNELLIKDKDETKGQIAFCTFHQSFSYEDFVEGIKPKIFEKDEVKRVYYDIEPGVFKQICLLADSNNSTVKVIKEGKISWSEEAFKKASFYKLSLGEYNNPVDRPIYEYCRDNNYIAIGFGQENDFTGLTESEIVKKCDDLELEITAAQQMNYFIHYLKKDNYIIISNGNKYVRAIGKVVGDYEYVAESPIRYNHFRKVEWLFVDENIPIEEIYERGLSQKTMYKIDDAALKQDFFINKEQKHVIENKEEKKYVLIIDEINRGNVSSIFGELITLIEEGKRVGEKEQLEVILPYSKESFKVPNNVYIIGTMNTADRSVESLDTALRRRFNFTEMMPKPELISQSAMYSRLLWEYEDVDWDDLEFKEKEEALFVFLGVSDELISVRKIIWDEKMKGKKNNSFSHFSHFSYSGIDLKLLLETINNRIEVLLDRNHKIGHSYLMNVTTIDDLKNTFKNKIIPLLQEYFYNDYEKIALVLGEGFVKITKPQDNQIKFAKLSVGVEQPEIQTVFSINEEFDIQEAINLLLGSNE